MSESSTTGAFFRRFGDVDNDTDGDALIAHQRATAALGPLARSKRRSYELLGVVPGNAVLDVGCGSGDDVRALAAIVGSGGRAVGVDASALAIRRARTGAPDNARFVVADAAALPFEAASFDACRSERTLQHLERPRLALGEIARITRPRGLVVATEATIHLLGTDELDREITPLVLGQLFPGDGWIGYFLPLLFRQAGLGTPVLEHHTGRDGGWANVRDALALPTVTRSVIEAQPALAPRVDHWLRACQDAAEAGTIELDIHVLHVIGQAHAA